MDDAWQILEHGASQHEYGGAVAPVAQGSEIILHRATGWAVREPVDERAPMRVDTMFDLASLTKVIATTPAILILVAEGRIGLDQPVGEILPEFGTAGQKAGVTIARLLSHTAGFRAGIPVREDLVGEAAYLAEFAATQPEWHPGSKVVYGDPGFMMLGAVVQRMTNESIAVFAQRAVFGPLGMTSTMYVPPAPLQQHISATEYRAPAPSEPTQTMSS